MEKENKQQPTKEEQKQKASSQAFLDIAEIKDGIVVLKNGDLRSVLMARSTNFALKSEQEKNAIIYAYQGFVNSLNFPIQIIIRSKKLDLDNYINRLEELKNKQTNELLALQTTQYIEFIKGLLEVCNIMTKGFYIIVPQTPSIIEKGGFLSKMFGSVSKKQSLKKGQSNFEINKVKLLQRVDMVTSGLGSVGIRSTQLNTQELVELFYNIYNPGLAHREKLYDIRNLTPTIVKREK